VCDCYSSSLPPSPKRATNIEHLDQNNAFSATAPFNHDIARTLFAPLFFSLYHYNSNNRYSPSTRHRYDRPSPFEDPSCARTSERMLRRMMENRHRSDGRTVCPDGRTFSLVAGSFGRLRCGELGRGRGVNTEMVTWEEELVNVTQLRNVTYSGRVRSTPIDKIQQLLQIQLKLCHQEGWPIEIQPSVAMYNRLLKRLAWQSGRSESQTDDDGVTSAAEQAWLWLQLMKSPLPQNRIFDDERIVCRPDAMTYAHVIEALSAYRVFIPPKLGKKNNSLMGKPVSTFEPIQVLAGKIGVKMASCGRKQSSFTSESFLSEAETLLLSLEDEYNDLITTNPKDSRWSKVKVKRALAHSYHCLLEAWGRFAVTGVGIDTNTSSTENVHPGEYCDNSLSQSRERSIMRAHELLCKLEALQLSELDSTSTSQASVVPSSCYSSVILALSMSDLPSAAIVAEDALERMISHYRKMPLLSSLLNVKYVATAFSGCIAAHAKNNDAPKAEKILNKMLDLYADGKLGPDFVPEVRAFGTCIALWGKYDSETAIQGSSQERRNKRWNEDLPSHQQRLRNADRAEKILLQLETVAENEAKKNNSKFAAGLCATPYNIALLARVQTIPDSSLSTPYSEKGGNEQIILRAQELLDHMEYDVGIQPDSYSYSILLHAWCQQSRPGNEKAADYAEALLRRKIEAVGISKIRDDGDSDIINSSREPRQSEIWPNVKHFSSVLKAHAKTKSAGGAKKALALLSEMEQRFYDADVVVDDDDSSYSTEFHVERRDVAKPDLVCYSIVIDAFANSRLPEASSVAHRLLRAVEAKYENGDISMKPNARIYTAVILSLVHSPQENGGGERERGGDNNTPCGRNNNAQRAWSLLEEMKKNDIPPNSFTYNYVINCCSHDTEDQRSSFEVAIRAFQELRKASEVDPDIHPDSFTFAFVIKACSNLLPPCALRTKVIAQAFKECCRSGYLNDAVLDRLWRGLPKATFHELVKEKSPARLAGWDTKNVYQYSPIKANDLPVSWSRCCASIRTMKSRRGEKLIAR
jgi:pentatricopeptide repeat protein